jgi:D-alanyl-D-alanine carboxypeptidase
MKTLRRLLCPLLFFAGTLPAQSVDPALAAALQSSINTLRATYQVKGISAAAWIPGQGLWQGVTGFSHDTVAIDSTMLFSMGSITKTFVAAEIFKLVDEGQLSLDDSLDALIGPHVYVDSTITVRQLLGHTSGLGDYINSDWEVAMFADPYRVWYFPEALDTFISPPVGPPGSPWNYCNANYALLGMIVEAKRSDSLHHILRNDFLTPLNLGNTYMEVFEPYPNPIPHNWSTPTLNPSLAADSSATPHEALWSSGEADGGYFCSPVDLVEWGHALYSLTEMTTFTPVAGGYFNGYGLGSMRFVSNFRTYWGHAGNFYGYAACMLYYPQDSICVALLINQDCIAASPAKSFMNTLINNLATGIDEPAEVAAFSFFPNPAAEQVTITCDAAPGEISTLVISDITGRVIHSETVSAFPAAISTTGFPAGTYMLTLETGQRSSTQKLVIAH